MNGTAGLRRLCEPIRIGEMAIKNRMVMPAMGMRQANNGFVMDRDKRYYEERAKGGAGLIIVEACSVDYRTARLYNEQHSMDDDKYIPGMSELVEVIHKNGAKAALQLHHGGNVVSSSVTNLQPVAPSAIARPSHEMPRELTIPEIEDIIARFAKATERAKKAGFDTVELSAAHRYIIQNFLSSAWNKRTDQYGGDLKNRARFLLEIIKAIRETVGEDYPLIVRLNGQEYGVEGGTTLEEAKAVALMVQEAGVHAVHMTAFPATYPYPRSTVPPTLPIFRPGCYAHFAEGVKRVVSIPVIAVGRISPELGEQILQKGNADLIAFGRGLIADPELPNKVKEGRLDEIRRCLGCNECYGFNPQDMVNKRCTVNAAFFRYEDEPLIKPVQRAKKIAIVGGGPGGMEAARVAAVRGHQVTLLEKSPRLGEQLRLASLFREEYDTLNRYLANQMKKLGVRLMLGREATAETLMEMKPDAIIVASGARSSTPAIPGMQGKKVISAERIRQRRFLWHLGSMLMGNPLGRSFLKWCLTFGVIFGRKIVVMGGGLAGGEMATFLMERGKSVILLTEREKLEEGVGTMPVLKQYYLNKLAACGIPLWSGVKYGEITERGLSFKDKEGKDQVIETDAIVWVAEVKPNHEIFKELKEKMPEVYIVGDSAEPRGILEAISEGFSIGRSI